jgi:predicted nucleotidyltransferase
MSSVVTVAERKSRETARRRAAADLVVSEMRAFGAKRGGRFLIFGSVAEDRMKFDSDLDVVVDFPADREAEALEFVEDICRKHGLPSDVHLKSEASGRFLDRIRGHMVQIP